MILLIIKMILLTTVWTLGWRVAVSDGMILEKLGQWGEKKVDEGHKIFNGLIICPFCIPNIHSILFVWPLAFGLEILPFEWNVKYLFMYSFCIMGSSFISGFIWTVYITINGIKENNE